MPPPPDLSAYHLSDVESQQIFESQIRPIDIDPIPVSPTPEKPQAVLILGQTGAGKTRLAPKVLDDFAAAQRKPVHLIADVYKTHHPRYEEIIRGKPQLASPATGVDARKWLRMATETAAQRRLDICIESACRHPEDFSALAQILHDALYHVSVVILAVPYALSRLGVLVRYLEKAPEAQSRGLPLRLTPVKVHDDSYEGLIKAADWLDGAEVADRVLVVRRGEEEIVAYDSGTRAIGDKTLGAREALLLERSRPLSPYEKSLVSGGLSVPENAVDDKMVKAQAEETRELLEKLLDQSHEVTVELALPGLRQIDFGSILSQSL